MQIKAVKFRKEGFYSQPFVFGGEEGMDKFDPKVRYRGSLQNYLIDTGDEVILVDTGLPAGTPEESPDETSLAFTGKDICSYMDALANLGYKPEQVTKILLTHKHADHSGELKSFPNAKIFVNEEELSADELQGIPNLVPVKFTDGAYYNFTDGQKIKDGIYFIKAKGHTNGNSIVIVENDGLIGTARDVSRARKNLIRRKIYGINTDKMARIKIRAILRLIPQVVEMPIEKSHCFIFAFVSVNSDLCQQHKLQSYTLLYENTLLFFLQYVAVSNIIIIIKYSFL